MGRKGDDGKLPQFVDHVVSIGARTLTEQLGTPEHRARELMRGVAHELCGLYARTHIYVPIDAEWDLSVRDKQMWEQYGQDSLTGARKFTSARASEIAAQYELTVTQVYNIFRLARARQRMAEEAEFAARQGALPLDV
jgi:Mor family transcriptional regulator